MKKLTDQQKAIEYYKCKKFPLYFIHNYVYIGETGGMFKYTTEYMHAKLKQTVRSVTTFKRALLMASRQLGKTSIAAALIEWANNFHPNMRSIILTYSKVAAYETLDRIKFIHYNLPNFLKVKFKHRGDRKTYVEYDHGSRIDIFFTSGNIDPNKIARSLTSPILYVDECALIRGIDDAYGAAFPTLFRAQEQAKRNGYPYFTLLTSTPNGVIGDGKFFFDMYNNAVDSNDIFDDDCELMPEAEEIVNDPTKNGFVKIKYHWSEDDSKDDAWYLDQKRGLNFDSRKINQELDLMFVGSTSCLFEDEFLSRLKSIKPTKRVRLPHSTRLNLYAADFDMDDYLLIGTDSAKSLTGDFNAIEIFSYANFIQIGEYFGKLGSIRKYSDVIMVLTQKLARLTNNRLILCIENNNIGSQIIENLELGYIDEEIAFTYDINPHNFDYMQYVYTPNVNKTRFVNHKIKVDPKYVPPGINTNASTKNTMVSHLYDLLVEDPSRVSSSDFISQLNVIEKKSNGSVSAQSGQHDDLFMAAAFCAFVRRLSALDIEPLIGVENLNFQQKRINEIKEAINIAIPEYQSLDDNNKVRMKYDKKEGGIVYDIESYEDLDRYSPFEKDEDEVGGGISDSETMWGIF